MVHPFAALAVAALARSSAPVVRTAVPSIVYTENPALNNTSVPPSWAQQPLGNGNFAAGFWVEEPGDLVAYLSSPTAYDELHQLIKLGKVRISFSNTPFGPGTRSVLHMENASLAVTGPTGFTVKLWVDANAPVLFVESQGVQTEEFTMQIKTEIYRTNDPVGRAADSGGSWVCYAPGIDKPARAPDVLVDSDPNKVLWYHRNGPTTGILPAPSLWESELRNQGLEALLSQPNVTRDPLTNNTFGVALVATAGSEVASRPSANSIVIRSKMGKATGAARSHEMGAVDNTGVFESALAKLAGDLEAMGISDVASAWQKHEQWWGQYWNQSYVRVRQRAQ